MRAIQSRAPTRSRKILEGTSNKKKTCAQSKGCVAEAKRLIHMKLGEADINAIKIGNEVTQDKKWYQPPHHLSNYPLFYIFHGKGSGFCSFGP